MISEVTGVDSTYCIPDVVWNRIIPLLYTTHRKKKNKKTGRPRMDDRKAMSAIYYILRTGCQWNALPRSLGASSTVHDRFQEWIKAGVFKRMWIDGLAIYDNKTGIDWKYLPLRDISVKGTQLNCLLHFVDHPISSAHQIKLTSSV
ncbi:MAG: transposase [Nitrososphaeraceae archaeon]